MQSINKPATLAKVPYLTRIHFMRLRRDSLLVLVPSQRVWRARRDLFACRECNDLGYLTSRRSGKEWKQAELRYRRTFEKADAENRRPHPNNAPYFPTRPKGTHQDTFEDLTDDVQEARREWGGAMTDRLLELRRQYRDVADDPLV